MMKEKLTYFWYFTICTLFLGPWAKIFECKLGNIYLFRITLVVFIVISTIYSNVITDFNSIKEKKYLYFFIIWFFWAIIQCVWTQSISESIKVLINLLCIITVIFYTNIFINTEKKKEKILYLINIIYFVFLIVGLWENITSHHLWVSEANTYVGHLYLYRFIPTAFYNNPNDFATFISLYIPFIVLQINKNNKKIINIVNILLVILSIDFLLVTSSRANMFSVIISFIVYILFRRDKVRKKAINILLLIIVVVVLNYLNSIIEFNKGYYSQTIRNIFRPNNVSQVRVTPEPMFDKTDVTAQGGSVKVRLTLIEDSLYILKQSKLLGASGANSVNYLRQLNNVAGLTNFHNFWAEILANYGVLIFLGFIAIYIWLYKDLFKILRNNIDSSIEFKLAMSLIMSLSGFTIACVSSSSVFFDLTVWFIFALAISVINNTKNNEI